MTFMILKTMRIFLVSNLNTVCSNYCNTLVLVGFRAHQTLYSLHFDEKKMFQHSALARTCMSHNAAIQEKMLHCSVLIGFGTHHGFWSELTGTEVPLCSSLFIYLFICWYLGSVLSTLFVSFCLILIKTS